jgi:hypothetical protein
VTEYGLPAKIAEADHGFNLQRSRPEIASAVVSGSGSIYP